MRVSMVLVALVLALAFLSGTYAGSPTDVRPETGRSLLASRGNAFDYGQVLGMSYLFYEAQRSGKLPASQRVKWRGDSCLQDKGPQGQDLSGGYFDAGDHVKFGMTQAFTVAMLAWGVAEFPEGINKAGQMQYALEALRWGSDYLLKSVLDDNKIVAQVGAGQPDHNIWRRAEDVMEQRPVCVCTPDKPASDFGGATAAALAATAVAFRGRDQKYSDACLSKAKVVYNFAKTYQGRYQDKCCPDASQFYPSTSYYDDLAFAALWLKKATGDSTYTKEAAGWYSQHKAKEDFNSWKSYKYGLFWSSYSPAVALMLANETGEQQYWEHFKGFIEAWTSQKGNEHVNVSPMGYAWYIKDFGWGNLRHMGNAAFLVLLSAKYERDQGERDRRVCWAHGQISYALGEGGRSYVVGFGNNPPQRPHHRSASCPWRPQPCDYKMMFSPGPNPQVITGALVGGPDPSDIYRDDRMDARNNEVAIDYNAGWTGALAALNQAPVDYDYCKSKGMQRRKLG